MKRVRPSQILHHRASDRDRRDPLHRRDNEKRREASAGGEWRKERGKAKIIEGMTSRIEV